MADNLQLTGQAQGCPTVTGSESLYMPRVLLILLGTFIGLSPISANACQLCTESMIHWAFPAMWPVVGVLVVWRLIYAYLQMRDPEGPSEEKMIAGVAARLAIVGALFIFIFGRAVVIVYLAVSYCRAILRVIEDWWKLKRTSARANEDEDERASETATPVSLRNRTVLHGIAFLILAAVIPAMYVRRAQMSEFDAIISFTTQGTSQTQILLRQLGANPSFDTRELIPHIQSYATNSSATSTTLNVYRNEREMQMAFQLLNYRSDPEDFILLHEYIVDHPLLDRALTDEYPDSAPMHLRYWLSGLGFDNESKTREEFDAWAAEMTGSDNSQK